jgi:hypothetical protein
VSAPLLTPLDSPVFDDDVIAGMEERFDDPVTCRGCERSAVAVARMRCCGTSGPICGEHLDRSRRMLGRHPAIQCGFCKADISGRTFEQVVDLVPL